MTRSYSPCRSAEIAGGSICKKGDLCASCQLGKGGGGVACGAAVTLLGGFYERAHTVRPADDVTGRIRYYSRSGRKGRCMRKCNSMKLKRLAAQSPPLRDKTEWHEKFQICRNIRRRERAGNKIPRLDGLVRCGRFTKSNVHPTQDKVTDSSNLQARQGCVAMPSGGISRITFQPPKVYLGSTCTGQSNRRASICLLRLPNRVSQNASHGIGPRWSVQ
jgi:hypothetical protein